MTKKKSQIVIKEFMEIYKAELPFRLEADAISIYIKVNNQWKEYLSFKIGGNS